MPPRGSMNQDRVFYHDGWTREVDDVFVRGLAEQTIAGNPIIRGNANRRAIIYCKDRVNGVFATQFSYDDCLDRFRKLYNRYQVFNYIINYPGVVHNDTTNAVQASEETWDAICQVHDLAYAYMRRGEEEYDTLRFVFNAVPEVPGGGQEIIEVIQISSDTEPMSMDHDILSQEVDGTDDAHNYELAWYSSRSSSTATRGRLSSNSKRGGGSMTSTNRRPKIPRSPVPPASGPSSVASSSPFKN